MKKLVAVLFGLLVVATGLVAATTWAVTSVRRYNSDSYGYSWTEIGVKYDVQHPYLNYYITYRTGGGGAYGAHVLTGVTIIPDPNGAETIVTIDGYHKVVSSAGWPYV
ncbi:hypothetical protein [Thermococcus sp. 21S9]|uniref:hypothetical protein n=1 Tax=Thermococcus sp. 21S9 TaxID=1638223 RepID=UPI00143AB350|nr:hypothetical protein [Thermococcus sp. 21S9]NJE53737.1 hypothetical protein [Thermococcus sp. 21S9]